MFVRIMNNTSGFVESAGCKLAYTVIGAGAPVLFIQGVGVHGSGWNPQTETLSHQFQCLSFDNRGVGNSQPRGDRITVERMAADCFALMDHVQWTSAHIVSHSLGGLVAQEMALSNPGRVRSLSLLCTVSRGSDATTMSARMLWVGLRTRIGTARQRRHAFLELLLPAAALQGIDRDQLARELAPIFGHDLAVQPKVAMQQLSALRNYDATSRLSQIVNIPTLVMGGLHDIIAAPVHGAALAKGIAGARYQEYADAAHGLPIQHAQRVNAVLEAHVADAEERAALE